MTDLLVLDMVKKKLVTYQIVMTIGYDANSFNENSYKGDIYQDHYGRAVPRHSHGTFNLVEYTSSTSTIMETAVKLYHQIIHEGLMVRRVNITACNVISEELAKARSSYEQLSFFDNYDEDIIKEQQKQKEKRIQKAILRIQSKYGKNALLKGMNLQEAGMTRQRNKQIGGHKA